MLLRGSHRSLFLPLRCGFQATHQHSAGSRRPFISAAGSGNNEKSRPACSALGSTGALIHWTDPRFSFFQRCRLDSRRHCGTGPLAAISGTGISLLGTLAKVYGVVLVFLFFLQRKLIFLPPGYVSDPKARGGNPAVIILPASSDSSERYAAAFYPPKDADTQVFVYFHGNADQLGSGTAVLGQHFQAQYGLGFYGVEYPGYGLSQPGSPSEESINKAAETMLRHLIDELGVPPARITLFGQSLGCAVAVEMAARGLGGKLLLLSPFTSTLDMARIAYPFLLPALKVAPVLIRDAFDNAKKAASLTLPTLIIHGQADEIVPCWMGERLSALVPDARFMQFPGMGHNDVFDRPEVFEAIAEFARQGQHVSDK